MKGEGRYSKESLRSLVDWMAASNIAAADALTLPLHNQHALAAAIEEVTVWLSENGVETVAENAIVAMETLDMNAKAITDAIMRLRQS